VVIDRQRILTCAHVARRIQDSGGEVWVAFPKSKNGPVSRLRVAQGQVVFADSGAEVQDLAILHLAEPVPTGVDPVPLRDPASASLLAGRWWAFGFPQGDPAGNSAQGTVGEVLASGLLRIDRKSRYGIESGFSGAGVWSPEYRSVVAVITEAEDKRGDGRAIPLPYLEACFPDEQTRGLTGRWSAVEAGDVALSAWGWSLTGDSEAEQHWSPRARGVTIDSEHGYRFQGRTAALQVIKDWLDRDRDRAHRRMLVVTGAPGAGKSAVLGRIVTTADADAVKELPASDAAGRANVGSVACAVHAKGKTALEVATEIARAASAKLPDDLEDFPRVLHAALIRQGRRFNVIIDALDEAVSLSEARNIIRKVILPMTETFSDVDARVVAGSRRAGSSGDLLGRYRESSRLVDLDDPEFYAQEDLAAYALATLQLAGDKRSESEQDGEKPNPYADARVAGPVAARIAELSAGNFLVAGLTARTRGMADDIPKSPEQLSFSPRISDVMDDYLELVPETAGIGGDKLLTALAFAESPGLPVSLWCEAIQALGYGNVTEVQLVEFTQTRAASFLVESYGQDGDDAVFRLFHQALNDALLGTDDPGLVRKVKERALTRAFMSIGHDGGWERASTYLLRSLPAHAARGGLVDDLLADDDYLLHADLRRVTLASAEASSAAARDRVRLLLLTPEAVTAAPAERAAMFSVTEALDQLGTAYQGHRWQAPYRAQWATARPRNEHATLKGHEGEVHAVCAVAVGGSELLATGSEDGTARLWDPRTGEQLATLNGHRGWANAVCAVTVGGRDLLATGSGDRTVRLWNPQSGEQIATLSGHDSSVQAVCVVRVDGQELLASGGWDGLRLWDPRTGEQLTTFDTPHRGLRLDAVCVVTVDGQELLASGGWDAKVRLWDPRTGEQLAIFSGHGGYVSAVCAVMVDGQNLLASGDGDGMVRLWDPRTGEQFSMFDTCHRRLRAVKGVMVDDRDLLATGSGGGTARLWDPRTGEQLATFSGHDGEVNAVCAITVHGQNLLATGGGDGTVRLWNLQSRGQPATLSDRDGQVYRACAVTVDSRDLLAASTRDTVRLWNLQSSEQLATLNGHHGGWFDPVCVVTVDGRDLLAVGDDGTVPLWSQAHQSEQLAAALSGYDPKVRTACAVTVDGQNLLATGDWEGEVRLWDPRAGETLKTFNTLHRRLDGLCAVTVDGQNLLATGGDETVRLSDPRTGRCVGVIPTHHTVHALAAVRDSLAIGLSAGILVIKLNAVTSPTSTHVMRGSLPTGSTRSSVEDPVHTRQPTFDSRPFTPCRDARRRWEPWGWVTRREGLTAALASRVLAIRVAASSWRAHGKHRHAKRGD
jgi:WD40 repeat protein